MTHELSVGKLQAWLNASGKTPREQAAKVTLREVLGGTFDEPQSRPAGGRDR
jgi:hypothetical protein